MFEHCLLLSPCFQVVKLNMISALPEAAPTLIQIYLKTSFSLHFVNNGAKIELHQVDKFDLWFFFFNERNREVFENNDRFNHVMHINPIYLCLYWSSLVKVKCYFVQSLYKNMTKCIHNCCSAPKKTWFFGVGLSGDFKCNLDAIMSGGIFH